MIVLVSDTSVLIDLERGAILIPAFNCGLSMVVPDVLYDDELQDYNGPYLRTLGLGVLALTPDELSSVQVIRQNRPTLSIPDSFALVLARRDQHALVTGDRSLRSEAEKLKITVYGLLWLLDQLEFLGVQKSVLYQGLSSISADVRCRLPKEEVKLRLERWA
jgi:predicted nucleic acid-binding protein